MAAKLHESLAVNSNLEGQAYKCVGELKDTFTKRHHLFGQKLITFQPNGEGAVVSTEEQSEMESTVGKELVWASDFIVALLNSDHQINEANTKARADIVLDDGQVFLKGLPATSLLELEKRIKWIQELITAVPTLDPAKGFKPDAAKGPGIFVAREVTKTRTAKMEKPIVLYDATKEHPAQTQLISQDVPTGTIRVQEWSSMVTPAQKSEMLSRCEKLQRAVKAARSRANDTDVDTSNRIGKLIIGFVLDGSGVAGS